MRRREFIALCGSVAVYRVAGNVSPGKGAVEDYNSAQRISEAHSDP